MSNSDTTLAKSAAAAPKTSRRAARNVCDLSSYPGQGTYYSTSPPEKIRALADDLRRNGLRHPIIVLPPGNKANLPGGTIIDGHDRVAAAKLLGWTEIDVIVRYDLADADPATVEREYLECNLTRKHLDPLDQARAVQRLLEIEKRREPGELWRSERTEARDRVGKTIGMSGRNLERYMNILATPIEIQRAFQRGDIRLVDGERIGCLDGNVQLEIASEIAAAKGRGDIREILIRHLTPREARTPRKCTPIAIRLVKDLQANLAKLDGRYNRIHGPTLKPFLAVLLDAQKAIPELIRAAKRPGYDVADVFRGPPEE